MGEKLIEIKGARVNNLKNIDLSLPLNKFIVITGVSGSGNLPLLSTLFTPRDKDVMWRVFRLMRVSFWVGLPNRNVITSRDFPGNCDRAKSKYKKSPKYCRYFYRDLRLSQDAFRENRAYILSCLKSGSQETWDRGYRCHCTLLSGGNKNGCSCRCECAF